MLLDAMPTKPLVRAGFIDFETEFYLKPGAVVGDPLLNLNARILDDARILDELLPEESAELLRTRPHRIKALLPQPLDGQLRAHRLGDVSRQLRTQFFRQIRRTPQPVLGRHVESRQAGVGHLWHVG